MFWCCCNNIGPGEYNPECSGSIFSGFGGELTEYAIPGEVGGWLAAGGAYIGYDYQTIGRPVDQRAHEYSLLKRYQFYCESVDTFQFTINTNVGLRTLPISIKVGLGLVAPVLASPPLYGAYWVPIGSEIVYSPPLSPHSELIDMKNQLRTALIGNGPGLRDVYIWIREEPQSFYIGPPDVIETLLLTSIFPFTFIG